MNIEISLKIVAALQLGIAILNLFLVQIMKWKEDLARLPLLMREVIQVHSWFITIILLIFSVMTWRFGSEMVQGSNLACVWLAGFIGMFWLFRFILQITYYSHCHWQGYLGRTLIHISCLIIYGCMATTYLLVAIQQIYTN